MKVNLVTFCFNVSLSNLWREMKYYEIATVTALTLRKYVAKYEQMWKWMVEFLSKYQGRGIKIDNVNSIRVTKSIISSISYGPLHREWHHVLSFALSFRLLPLVYILWSIWAKGCMFDDCVCYLTWHHYPSLVDGKSHGILLYYYNKQKRRERTFTQRSLLQHYTLL